MDESEPADVRIGAFVILRNARPSYVTLQAIVHRVHNERSTQLRTLMYTSLVSMAKYAGANQELTRLYGAMHYIYLCHSLCLFIIVMQLKMFVIIIIVIIVSLFGDRTNWGDTEEFEGLSRKFKN